VGWKSLDWLRVPLYSVPIVAGLVVASYLLPILMWSKAKWSIILACTASMYAAAFGGYWAGKFLFMALYSRAASEKHVWHVWAMILLVTVVAAIFFFLKQRFLFKSGRFHILTLVAVFITVVPASLATVEWIPGFGNGITFVDAVKMGYPMFWINVLLGWTAFAMVKKAI
jgi:hypothetical protein